MARVKRGVVSRKKHNKLLKQAKGYRGTRSTLIKTAREAVLHAGEYAFHGRKRRKRDMRRTWITRINEALREDGQKYSTFQAKLKEKNIGLNRKILAHLASEDRDTFREIVSQTFKK